MVKVATVVWVAAIAASGIAAQEPKPAFQVLSVKPNVSGAPGFGGPTDTGGSTPTGYRATNTTVHMLIRVAYRVDEDSIVGGPGWIHSRRFDIEGRAASEISLEQVRAMLRTLLEDRFKLVVATEQRMRDAYSLTLARADGRLGPDLRRAADDCDTSDRFASPERTAAWLKSMPRPSNGANPSSMNVCTTTENIAAAIGGTLKATVIDETGLTGRWDFVIAHAGLESRMRQGRNGTLQEYPSIFVAVQEQLGLKLERRREPGVYEVLAIRSVELPSEN